jgi:hypothetical protein
VEEAALHEWVALGDEAEALVIDSRIVAVTYAENVGPVGGSDAHELWWVPVEDPTAREVLFGVGEDTGDAWSTRWERARNATEWLYTEWLESRRRQTAGESPLAS